MAPRVGGAASSRAGPALGAAVSSQQLNKPSRKFKGSTYTTRPSTEFPTGLDVLLGEDVIGWAPDLDAARELAAEWERRS